MKRIIRDYFTFNKRERNGVFILLGIIMVQVIYLDLSSHFVTREPIIDTALNSEIEEFRVSLKSDPAGPADPVVSSEGMKQAEKAVERFSFDPNGLSEKDWRRLGLSDKQIRSIRNYENKGGRFRKKEDVKKMYCIPEQQYRSLEQYILIPQEKENDAVFVPEKSTVIAPKQIAPAVELNAADSAQLTTLKGIGPFFAKTIVKYRNSIGGFYSKEQLLEVWKFDREKLAMIENDITVDASKIKKININTCEAAELKSPYINWNIANGIVNYRKNHGKYNSIDEIRRTDLVDEETYRKIVPYLVTE
ncbi:MAG: helix-hairpin-helix domain-containing protein [Bacteroidia bacterium]